MEIEEYVVEYAMQILYVAKYFYDHDRLDDLLEVCGGMDTLDPAYIWSITEAAIGAVFRESSFEAHGSKWVTHHEYEAARYVHILRDPLLTRYDELCREYELKNVILPIENPYVKKLESAVNRAMQLDSYCYDYRWYDSSMRGGCRLILILDEEFTVFWQVTSALFEILDFCEEQLPKLEAELAGDNGKTILFPARTIEAKEAA